jgi:hypothetical protein
MVLPHGFAAFLVFGERCCTVLPLHALLRRGLYGFAVRFFRTVFPYGFGAFYVCGETDCMVLPTLIRMIRFEKVFLYQNSL